MADMEGGGEETVFVLSAVITGVGVATSLRIAPQAQSG